jgi:hypothetical protein
MRSQGALLVAGVLVPALLVGRSAAADPAEPGDEHAQVRSGVVVGTAIGYGLAHASGYPNNATLIGSPAYHSTSNVIRGANTSIFVMGALTDYVSFGFWLGGGAVQSSEWRSTQFGAGFRIEAFPLYRIYPKLRDLGVSTRLGLGRATLASKLPGEHPSAAGSESYLGAGVFYEFALTKLLGGHLAAGPSLDYDVVSAASIDRGGLVLSARAVFYGGM